MSLKTIVFVALAVIATANFVLGTGKINCNRPNEEYQCGSACQTTCENYGQTCPIVNIRCNDACYCINGYARNNAGDCIPYENCPK